MFGKITALVNLFKVGQVVANPAAWKEGTITVNTIATILAAAIGAATAFGFGIPITPVELNVLSTGILSVIGAGNVVMHYITSDKVGLLK